MSDGSKKYEGSLRQKIDNMVDPELIQDFWDDMSDDLPWLFQVLHPRTFGTKNAGQIVPKKSYLTRLWERMHGYLGSKRVRPQRNTDT